MSGVKRHLLSPEIIGHAMQAYRDELTETSAQSLRNRAAIERNLSTTEARIQNLLDLYERNAIDLNTFKERIAGHESRRDALRIELKEMEIPKYYSIHPSAIQHYRQLIDDLHATLAANDATAARDAFRGLLDHVVVTPTQEGPSAFDLEIHGRLAALLGTNQNTLPGDAGKGAVVMGAGTGFEPVTFRL